MALERVAQLALMLGSSATAFGAEMSSLENVYCEAVVSEIVKLSFDGDAHTKHPLTISYGQMKPTLLDGTRSCIQAGLRSAEVDARYTAATPNWTHVTVNGVDVAGDSASALFTSGRLPTEDHRGGGASSVLEFHQEDGHWIFEGVRYRKFVSLCQFGGCK